jgi:hypothetical protein
MTARLVGIAAADARTVEVTATLQQGAALPLWWPAPLDGILAAAARRARLGRGYGISVDHHREDLPLCAISTRGYLGRTRRGDVWAATCATPDSDAVEDVHWWHGRSLDARGAARVSDDPLPANTEVGRWKPLRIPLVVTATRTLRWRALGDPDRIRALLAAVPAIGKKRSQGEGMVLDWQVDDAGPPDARQVCWLDDGRIARPFPARYDRWLGVDTPDVVPHAARPPYWRAPQRERDGGGFERRWPLVIAPWTVRPEQ